MNKQERKLKGKFKQIKRMAIHGVNPIENPAFARKLKTTGNPCSCATCSPHREIPYKAKPSDLRKEQQYL